MQRKSGQAGWPTSRVFIARKLDLRGGGGVYWQCGAREQPANQGTRAAVLSESVHGEDAAWRPVKRTPVRDDDIFAGRIGRESAKRTREAEVKTGLAGFSRQLDHPATPIHTRRLPLPPLEQRAACRALRPPRPPHLRPQRTSRPPRRSTFQCRVSETALQQRPIPSLLGDQAWGQVLMLRHAESSPAEEVGDALNI